MVPTRFGPPIASAGITASRPGSPITMAYSASPFVVNRTSSGPRSLRLFSLNEELAGVFGAGGDGPVAEDLPWPRVVDRLRVHGHPVGDPRQHLQLVVVQHAAVRQREVQHQIAVAADDVRQQIDDGLRGLVGDAALVVPVADARVGLPRTRPDRVDDAALDVEDAGALLGSPRGACWCRWRRSRRRASRRAGCRGARACRGQGRRTESGRRNTEDRDRTCRRDP